MTSRVAVFAFVVLLVGSLPAAVVAAGPVRATDASAGSTLPGDAALGSDPVESIAAGTTDSAATTGGAADVLHRTTVLRHRPADPDDFEAETTFRVPDSVTQFEIDLERGAAVESTAGFERIGDGTYRWTEDTDEPTIRYTMPADRRGDVEERGTDSGSGASATAGSGAGALDDGYTFVDTGDWAVVPVPDIGITLRRTEPVGIEEAVTVDGPGATGGDIAFFGSVTEYERDADGETIRLVVPDDTDLRESPDAILAAVADASGRLDVGMQGDEVFMVAVPNEVDWGPRGLQYGRSDAWVVDDATLDEPNPVWLHEYVHARQRYSSADGATAPEVEWLVEGQADYYAGLLALEGGRADFGDFARLLERGERSPYADGVLVDRSTWTDDRTHYVKGALVYGEIDRRLRLATDGDRTLEDVFRTLNARDGTVTEADFLRAVEDAGGAEVRAVAEQYTRTEATPEMWTRSQHRAAFDRPVADFEYGFRDESIDVGGQAWERWPAAETDGVDGTRDVIAVPAGESVSLPVAVANAGDREGTYDATLQIDGRVVDHRQGPLAPEERATHRLSWTPTRPGEYEVRVGSERLTAVVRSAASVTVTDLAVTPDRADPGEPVTATATVAATGERPAAAVLEFRTVDGVAAERPVAIRPGESATVEADLRFDDGGRYEITVGDRTVTVGVGGPLSELESMPGFGVSAALVAVTAALAGALMARRRC
ncbi:hypothetical protein [Natrinema salifodinae]|uniref:Predicted metalloprotease, contains C-terminal PDZ domain n=1 Tax=Natrinema salifodinae TaxID=1202768 RepID=A0A1I0QIG9_9EURY|nr:hypothetical protein [Natrinema salifodinae]SEW26805.1 Predicted metalloprotease, contains C-terminal PDZ domain [Natrinema salifodinae]